MPEASLVSRHVIRSIDFILSLSQYESICLFPLGDDS